MDPDFSQESTSQKKQSDSSSPFSRSVASDLSKIIKFYEKIIEFVSVSFGSGYLFLSSSILFALFIFRCFRHINRDDFR